MDTTLRQVNVDDLGSALVAGAAIGAVSITVEDPTDFAEDGGQLSIGDVEYAYDACNPSTGVISLASGLVTAALADDPVYLLAANSLRAQEWTAECEFGGGEEPIVATIPTEMVPYFVVGDEQSGSTVSISDDGREGYRVSGRPGETAVFDGSNVGNPYVVRRATAASIPNNVWTAPTAWTAQTSQGVTVATGSVTIDAPGLYDIKFSPAYVTNGTNLRYARITVNGVQVGYSASAAESASTTFVQCLATEVLYLGDVVVMETLQNSGAALALSVGAGRSQMSLYRVSV